MAIDYKHIADTKAKAVEAWNKRKRIDGGRSYIIYCNGEKHFLESGSGKKFKRLCNCTRKKS